MTQKELTRQFSELVLPVYKMFYNTEDVPDNEKTGQANQRADVPRCLYDTFCLLLKCFDAAKISIETEQVAK